MPATNTSVIKFYRIAERSFFQDERIILEIYPDYQGQKSTD
jgi:hypothetical protein